MRAQSSEDDLQRLWTRQTDGCELQESAKAKMQLQPSYAAHESRRIARGKSETGRLFEWRASLSVGYGFRSPSKVQAVN